MLASKHAKGWIYALSDYGRRSLRFKRAMRWHQGLTVREVVDLRGEGRKG